ncbi:DUF397 domain-containing protein [Micromonospora chersina]
MLTFTPETWRAFLAFAKRA